MPMPKKWTQGAVVEAIRRFEHRYGRAPRSADFNPAQARSIGHQGRAEAFARDGDYPTATTVRTAFGSWNAAIRAAGFAPFGPDDHDWTPKRPSERLGGP